MSNEIVCFLLIPTKRMRRCLRRFTYSDTPGSSCSSPFRTHNASVILDEVDEPDQICLGNNHPHDDPMWPKTCICGYVFPDTDQWQLFPHPLFRRSDTGEITTIYEAPPGAIWSAPWMTPTYQGTDGQCLCLRTPGGDWMIDGPSRNNDGTQGPPWSRTGIAPKISASPSIIAGNYHGVLTDGVLRAC